MLLLSEIKLITNKKACAVLSGVINQKDCFFSNKWGHGGYYYVPSYSMHVYEGTVSVCGV